MADTQVVTTRSGRRVEIPLGYELVPSDQRLITLIRRPAPGRGLLIGLEIGGNPHYPTPFSHPPEVAVPPGTRAHEVERVTERELLGRFPPRIPTPYGPTTSVAPGTSTFPSDVEERIRLETERRRRGLPPLPAPPEAPPPRRSTFSPVERLGPKNLRIAILPPDLLQAVKSFAGDLGNYRASTVVPIVAYALWTARVHGTGGHVVSTFRLTSPPHLPPGPPYEIPVTQQVPVTIRTIGAVLYAIFGDQAPARRTILDALTTAGWTSTGELLRGVPGGEVEYRPPQRPAPTTSVTRFIPGSVIGRQFTFEA